MLSSVLAAELAKSYCQYSWAVNERVDLVSDCARLGIDVDDLDDLDGLSFAQSVPELADILDVLSPLLTSSTTATSAPLPTPASRLRTGLSSAGSERLPVREPATAGDDARARGSLQARGPLGALVGSEASRSDAEQGDAEVERPLRVLPPGTTTLMIRNVPARYTRERLLAEWPADGTYDLLYLPMNSSAHHSMGYAFVNCLTPDLALSFQRRWHGQLLSSHGRNKHLDVSAAVTQGFHETLRSLKNKKFKRQDSDRFMPALFHGTHRLNNSQVAQLLGIAYQ